jgi:diguanylate cyclase (GGDEF)-like protein
MRLRGSVNALPAAGCVLIAVAILAVTVLPMRAGRPVCVVANLGLIALLTLVIRRTARLPGLPRPTARFWVSLARALTVYACGMAVDLAILTVQAFSGTRVPLLGSDLIYPIAGLFTMYAVFQYPTTAGTRGEKITVGLDAGIVLLGGASFIWYFSVSRHWGPQQGWLGLSAALALPAMLLVAGFGILKIAFVGVGVLARRPLFCYATCVALAAFATTLPDHGNGAPVAGNVLLLLSQLASLTGAVLQYRVNSAGPVPATKRGTRRPFSVLPYGASAAAFVLLLAVVGPGLGWRQWGVLGGTGLLLCFVTVRQMVALRENGRLLAENRALNEQLQHQAWYDELTGLANRALYRRRVNEATQRYARQGTDTALFLVDLDDFKIVNDTLGHDVGDALLIEIAGRLAREVREADLVCRLGGDEFVVLVEDVDARHVAEFAERLVHTVATPVRLAEHTVRVGASIGIAFVSESRPGPADVLRRADVAMYTAKNAGKNGWRMAAQHKPADPQPVAAAQHID